MTTYRNDRCSRVEFLNMEYPERGYSGPVTAGCTRWRPDACVNVLACFFSFWQVG